MKKHLFPSEVYSYKNLLVFFLETSNVQIGNIEKEQDLRYRKTKNY